MTNPYDPNSSSSDNSFDSTNPYGSSGNDGVNQGGSHRAGGEDTAYGASGSANSAVPSGENGYGSDAFDSTNNYGSGGYNGTDATSGIAPYPGTGADPQAGTGYGDAAFAGGYENSPMNETKNGVAPWALGVGILSAVAGISIIFSVFAFIPGIIGLILGFIALSAAKKRQHKENKRKGMAITGLILSILGIVASVLFAVFTMWIMKDLNLEECANIQDPVKQQECVTENVNKKFGQDA